MPAHIYQLTITLQNSNPAIWRRILIPSDLLLSDLHKVIQTAMGWTNSHLHQFIRDHTFYTVKMEGDDFWEDLDNVDYTGMKVSELLDENRDTLLYEYDFGDGWAHEIKLDQVLPPDPELRHPVCLDGAMNCPPEDIGGVWGYAQMLGVLRQPHHEERAHYLEWLGEDFDPEYFNKDEVNALLRKPGFGCPGFF